MKVRKRILAIMLTMMILVTVVPTGLITSKAVSGSEIVNYARQFVGYPYVWGTQGPNSFDCSGLVQYVFKHFGISLPAGTSYYWNNPTAYGTVVGHGSTANAQPGDVISWSGHAAIYTENGYCIQALNPSYGVTDRIRVNSYINASGVNDLNYNVLRIYGVGGAVSAPTWASITANSDRIAVGSNITFNVSSDTATDYTIGIDKDNTRILTQSIGTSFTFTCTESGNYSAYVTATNSSGGVDSSRVSWVVESAPTWANIATSSEEIVVGSDIIFNVSSDTATNYAIGIDKDNERILTQDIESSFTFTCTESGNYSAYISAWNTAGGIDSQRVFWTVYEEFYLSDIHVETEPNKTVYTVGETFDSTGLKLKAVFSDGSSKSVTSGFTCSPTTLNTVGTQKITVTYEGKTTEFNVTVTDVCEHINTVVHPGRLPTCIEIGYSEATECLDCGEFISVQDEIGITSDHTDTDHDNYCDLCSTYIESREPLTGDLLKADSEYVIDYYRGVLSNIPAGTSFGQLLYNVNAAKIEILQYDVVYGYDPYLDFDFVAATEEEKEEYLLNDSTGEIYTGDTVIFFDNDGNLLGEFTCEIAGESYIDYNMDGYVTSDDAIYLLKHTMLPFQYMINGKADLDMDGSVTSDDAIYLLKHTMLPEMYPL